MAISKNLFKEKYKNLSIEELESKYEDLKIKNYCFNSNEEYIKYLIKNYLNASHYSNIDACKIALEELLLEKTGKEYKIEEKKSDLKLQDVINYIFDPKKDIFWTNVVTKYFSNLDVSDKDKIWFLVALANDNDSLNEFTKEIIKCDNNQEIYNKYKKITHEFYLKNSRKG